MLEMDTTTGIGILLGQYNTRINKQFGWFEGYDY